MWLPAYYHQYIKTKHVQYFFIIFFINLKLIDLNKKILEYKNHINIYSLNSVKRFLI